MQSLTIRELARMIKLDWTKPYFGAVPYLQAMSTLNSIDDKYGWDSGESVIRYFLSNAATWRGPCARDVKAELKRRLK